MYFFITRFSIPLYVCNIMTAIQRISQIKGR